MPAGSRTSTFEYDALSRYRIKETNPLGHSETTAYHPVHGLPVSKTGPNGLTTTWDYDGFGRAIKESRADGTSTTTAMSFVWSAANVLSEATPFKVVTQSTGSGQATVLLDRMNREFEKQAEVSGKTVVSRTYYDHYSRVIWKSEPFFTTTAAADIQWTKVEYDLLGRPARTIGPHKINGQWAVEAMTFDANVKVSTNPTGQTKTITVDGLGRPKTIRDNAGSIITYTYDAIGQTIEMASSAGTSTRATYNERGLKTSDTDPDKGTWTYRINALGLVVEQSNAKGQVTRNTFDIMGRALTRVDDANAPIRRRGLRAGRTTTKQKRSAS